MRANHVRRRLKAGEPSIGTWLSLPSPEAVESMSQLGLDWLTIDAEHNAIDIGTIAAMFRAMANSTTAPMVRIPWNTGENIKRVLDAGAWGIVVPMVNSKEEAERAVEAARYYPQGDRSVGGGRHALSFATTGREYFANANEEVLVVLQIEHIKGVENAEEILSVPGVDCCFIGPNDLGASMGLGIGLPLEGDHPRIVEAIEHVRVTCNKHGVAPGIHTSGAEAVNMRIEQGFQYCAMAGETKYLLGGLSDDIAKLNWKASEPLQVDSGVKAEALEY